MYPGIERQNAALAGYGVAPGPRYHFEPYDYVYNVVLDASVFLNDSLAIDNDSDFIWKGVLISSNTAIAWRVRFSDSQMFFLSSDLIDSANLSTDPADPYAIYPEVVIPAGGRIGVDIEEQSAAENTIQMMFLGMKRYIL